MENIKKHLIIKTIYIENIGAIEKLLINKDNISNIGCSIEASNRGGKTTIIKAINSCLHNKLLAKNRSLGLKPTEAIRMNIETGEYLATEGLIEITLEDINTDEKYEAVLKYILNGNNEVSIKYQLASPVGMKSSVKDIQKQLEFCYITPEIIQNLCVKSQKSELLTKNERELIEYFTYGLDEDIKEEFDEYIEEEQKYYDKRATIGKQRDQAEAFVKANELSGEETLLLEDEATIQKSILEIENDIKKAEATITNNESKLSEASKLSMRHTTLSNQVDELKRQFKKEEETIIRLEEEQSKTDNTISTILNVFYSKLSFSSDDIDLIKKTNIALNQHLSSLQGDTIVKLKEELNRTSIAISESNVLLDSVTKSMLDIKDIDLKSENDNLQATIRDSQKDKATLIEKANSILIVKSKQFQYEKHLKVYEILNKEWIELDNNVLEARKAQVQLMKDNGIEIPGFEISSEGLKFNGLSINSASGMQGVKFATLFAEKMNKYVKTVFIDERSKFDFVNWEEFKGELTNRNIQIISNEPVYGDIKVKAL